MIFQNDRPLHIVLNALFSAYRENVSDVDKITHALIDHKVITDQSEIINDHIAFRTLGVRHLGIQSFEKIFLHYGYVRKDAYRFDEKKLNAFWYAPPSPEYPRIFISELQVHELSEPSRKIIEKYTSGIQSDPVDSLDLDNGHAVADFLHNPLWDTPSVEEYDALLAESEYAAWVIYNRYYLNHYTISVHELPDGYNTLEEFNAFLERIGIKLNTAGGTIKKSKDGYLLQSSSVAPLIEATFAGGKTKKVSGSYVEFAERRVLPQFANLPLTMIGREHRREGFEMANADKIFESTYSDQTNR